jgi:amino acid adenylation domain-containing protein
VGHSYTADDGTLSAYLARAVSRYPGRPAVRERFRQVSYAELDEIVNCVAGLFVSRGPLPGARIGVWLNKSVEAVATIYASLRAGAAYVPVDPTSPPRHAARVLADSDPAWLVTTPERAASLDAVAPEVSRRLSLLLVGDAAGRPALPARAAAAHRVVASWEETLTRYAGARRVTAQVGADEVAYILYTSGSTGTPKGVVLTHGNARAFVDWAAREFALASPDVLASHAPFHFDLSILDLFGAAAGAACVSLVPDSWQGLGSGLVRFVADQHVSVWYSVPSALQRVAEAGNSELLQRSGLRIVAFAGEEYPVRRLRLLGAVLPQGTALYNLYGPTETNVCTYHRLGAGDLAGGAAKAVPIGMACPYASTVLLGSDGHLSAAGETTGELCVAGSSVMRGYWRDAEKTALSMFESGGVQYYRTGDIVRSDTSGQYTFVGRVDGMVKVKGHRIELGEIEAVLEGRPDVREAVCLVVPGPADMVRLVALVTAAPEARPEERSLRRYCRDHLPGYMVPECIKTVAALRYTSTGKVDRRSMAVLAEGTEETVPRTRS